MREGCQVSDGTLRQLGLDSRDATTALTDLVNRGLAYKVGRRRDAKYLLAEDRRPDEQGLLDDPLPEHAGAARAPVRQRYDRIGQIEALFADGRTMTASQVAATSGLGLALTNRYLARLLAAGELVATALSAPDAGLAFASSRGSRAVTRCTYRVAIGTGLQRHPLTVLAVGPITDPGRSRRMSTS